MNRDIFGERPDLVSISFLQDHCPPEGFWVACSFGKDSIVALDLVRRSGCAHEVHYNNTTCDPPELLAFAKEHYPDVAWDRPKMSMWALIERKGLPSRQFRFCCDVLKERGGIGRRVVTGIRAEESVARRHRGPLEQSKRGPAKSFIHPIFNWSSADVWQYIREHEMPYCRLYDEGYRRIGCTICPFHGKAETQQSLLRWPKIWAAARRAFQRRWDKSLMADSVKARFADAEAMWQWWIARDEPYPEPQRTCEGIFV